MPQPLRWKRKIILIKTEGASPGVDAVPVVATDAMLVRNFKITPLELQTDTRELDLMTAGNQGKLVFGKLTRFDFDFEMAGAGAAGSAAPYGAILKACCWAETLSAGVSAVYSLINPGAEVPATMYFYVDGKLYKSLYSLGSLDGTMPRGKIPLYHAALFGIYSPVSDAALAAPTLTPFQKPLVVSNANTTPVQLGTYAIKMSEFKFSQGNVLVYRNTTSSEAVRFVDRNMTGSVKFEEEKVATKDFDALAAAGTSVVFTATHGTAAGNKVKLDAGQAYLDPQGLSDEDSIAMRDVNMDLTPTSAGNDEFTITVL